MSSTPDVSGSDAAKPGLTDPTLDERIGQQWYQPRIPRAVLKDLMKRSDAEGLRNFVPWLVLLGHVVGGAGLPRLRHDLFVQRRTLARTRPWHAIQDPLAQRRVLSPLFVHDDPRRVLVALESRPSSHAHVLSGA